MISRIRLPLITASAGFNFFLSLMLSQPQVKPTMIAISRVFLRLETVAANRFILCGELLLLVTGATEILTQNVAYHLRYEKSDQQCPICDCRACVDHIFRMDVFNQIRKIIPLQLHTGKENGGTRVRSPLPASRALFAKLFM